MEDRLIKVGSIVKDLEDGQLYEIREIKGYGLILRSVNKPGDEEICLPYFRVELIMEEASDAFDVLFGESDDT